MSDIEIDDTVDNVLSASDTTSATSNESDDSFTMEGDGVHDDEAAAETAGVSAPSPTNGGGVAGSVDPASGAGVRTASGPPRPATTGTAMTTAAIGDATATTATNGAIPATVMQYVAMGVAAGDGDLMPPRFAGDRRSNASEWVRDFTDYVKIRNIPADTARVLLRNRLTDVARQWLERLPPDLELQDVLSRFQSRFGDTDATRDRLTTDFWGRRQRADEPAEIFIEGMASLARRIRLDNPHFLRQAILNGLRPELQMAVKLQHPTTLEEIAAAAAIAEAGSVTVAQPTPTPGTAATGSPAPTRTDDASSMRDLVAAIKELVAAQTGPTATAATPTVAGTATATPTPAAMPCYVVMQGPPPPDGGRGAPSGRFGRGRGRGWRGPGRGRPTQPNSVGQHQQLDPAVPAYQPAASASTGQPVINGQPDSATCQRCGRMHNEGECNAMYAVCYNCGKRGHFSRCCFSRTQ